MYVYTSTLYPSLSSSDAPTPATVAEGPSGPVKRAYEQPEVESIGSVPQITGGSDIFGDGPG